MSTIIAVKKNGFATIAADTLTKFGDTKESSDLILNHSKIMKAGNNYIAHVGHASWDLILSSYFERLKRLPSMTSAGKIFEMARRLHKVLKEDYYLNPTDREDDPFECSQTECLIVNPSGIFGLYALRSVQEYSKFYAFGSGYAYALGAMYTLYSTKASSDKIALAGIEAAAEFNDSTGLPVEMYTIKLRRT